MVRRNAGDFRFSIKIPGYVVEERDNGGKIKNIGEFLEFNTSENKILCITISPQRPYL